MSCCTHAEFVDGRCHDCGVERSIPDWLLDAAALLAEGDPGPTPWLVEDLMVDQALIAAVGRWKTTKSYALASICISIVTGEPAFGTFAIPTPGPVVYVNEESGQAALWRRLDALCRGRAIDPERLRDGLFVAPNARMKLDDPRWQERLLTLGQNLKPRLFAFDPLSRMKAPSRDESAQSEMAGLIEFLRLLRDETNAGALFVHHTGHQGEHMRGSSDLESAWETRLAWKREGPEVTIESEHRDAEPGAPFTYRIAWEGEHRTMRFEPVEDDLTASVRKQIEADPTASANAIAEAVGGNRQRVLSIVRALRSDGGSEEPEPPQNHPAESGGGRGSPVAPLSRRERGAGTTPAAQRSDRFREPRTDSGTGERHDDAGTT